MEQRKNHKTSPYRCEHCGPIYTSHFGRWIEDLFYFTLLKRVPRIPAVLEKKVFGAFNWILMKFGVLELTDDMAHKKIFFRTKVFAEEAEKLGIKIKALRSRYGFVNYFYMEKDGKKYGFEGIPRGEEFSRTKTQMIDDKIWVKRRLKKHGLPYAEGRAFSLFRIGSAVRYAERLGYPVIVKPAMSSMSQHITTNIKDKVQLKKAIRIALSHGPVFIVERYLENKNVYRATVIGFNKIACAHRVPANVTGDGIKTIGQLVEEKNQDESRGEACSEDCSTFKLVVDEKTVDVLEQKGLSLDSIPQKGERVYLQEKVILDIGADIDEVTPFVHPDNKKLFEDTAQHFDALLVGIDLLADDVATSWKDQDCAIIELNTMPFIDIHHHPTFGEPVNTGKMLAEMVEEYYFKSQI